MKRAFILTSKNGYSTLEVPEETWNAFKEFYDKDPLTGKLKTRFFRKSKFLLVILLPIIGVLLFYWFQQRPSEIRSYCDFQVMSKNSFYFNLVLGILTGQQIHSFFR